MTRPSVRTPPLYVVPANTRAGATPHRDAAFTASHAFAIPAPHSEGVQSACDPFAGVLTGNGRAVFCRISFTCSGSSMGFTERMRLAIPVTWAVAMLVPFTAAKYALL